MSYLVLAVFFKLPLVLLSLLISDGLGIKKVALYTPFLCYLITSACYLRKSERAMRLIILVDKCLCVVSLDMTQYYIIHALDPGAGAAIEATRRSG
jgi:hypothetical protein